MHPSSLWEEPALMAHFSLLSPSSVRGTLEILAHTVDILNNLHTVPYTPVHTLRHLLFEEVTLENMLVLRAFSFREWKENSGRTNAELPRLIRKSHRQTPSKSQEGKSSRFTPVLQSSLSWTSCREVACILIASVSHSL